MLTIIGICLICLIVRTVLRSLVKKIVLLLFGLQVLLGIFIMSISGENKVG